MEWEKKLKEAKEILSSAEHMFYVTFKHSKNANVLQSVISKLAEALEKLVDSIITYYYEEGVIDKYSRNPSIQLKKLIELLSNNWGDIGEFEKFYVTLRKIRRAKVEALNNFKRTVKLKIYLDNNKLIVGPKEVLNYLTKVKEYFKYLEDIAFK